MAKQTLKLALKTDQRLALMGRMRMAEWIHMREPDFARHVEDLEKDPLFGKLFEPREAGGESVIRRQRWPGGRLAGGFYELNEAVARGGERVKVEESLQARADLVPLIRRMGREAFERYFVYADEPLPLPEIARRTGLSEAEARSVNELLLDIGAQQEFAGPSADPGQQRAYSCLARISLEQEEPVYEFLQPYWARGLYHIRYELLERWKREGLFDAPERRRLRHLLKRVEMVNLRQNTLFRILETVTRLQADFLRARKPELKRPISLRMLARRLDLAPSTVSRALASRSVRLPWGPEAPLIQLVPGRRAVVRDVLACWFADPQGRDATDAELAGRLAREYGIRIARRTVNAVRHQLRSSD